jgi:hypothetical protein
MAIAQARPGLVLAGSALAAGIAAPLGMRQWMAAHNSFVGNFTVSVPGVGAVPVDARWAYVMLGIFVAISYSALAGIALILSRSARRATRNAITLAMLPVFFALAWFAVRSPR